MPDDPPIATLADVWPGVAPPKRRPELPPDEVCPRTNKIRHKHRGAARRHLDALACKDGELMNVYRCDVCGDWHVGHL